MTQKTKAKNVDGKAEVANAIKTNYPWLYYSKMLVFGLFAVIASWVALEN